MRPDLFHIGKFAVPTYGVLAALGLILGLFVCVHYARKSGLDEDKCWNLGVISIFAGILGAKVLLLLIEWDYYSKNIKQIFTFNLLQSGGVWYGGVIAAVIAGTICAIIYKLPVLRTADAYAPGIALGHSVGRLGCLAASCCYGKPTNVSWGVVFTDPRAHQLANTPLNVRLHPTQLYEWAAEFAIFLLLSWMFPRKRFDGQIAGTYLFVFGIARFIIEYWRGDPDRGSLFGGAISATQLISILLVLLGGALWVRWGRAEPAPSAAAV